MTPDRKPRIGIVGAGAVGGYYGGLLARNGRDVAFLVRSDYDAIKANGLRILSPQGNFTLEQPQVFRDASEMGTCDWILVTLKSTSNAQLPSILKPLMHSETRILTLQNGLGNEDFLSQFVPEEHILGGLCFVCINRLKPGVISHLAEGTISLGEYERHPGEDAGTIASWLKDSGIPVTIESNLKLARWRKLVWNIPFNGIAIAAGGIHTQQMLQSPALTEWVRLLMHEVLAIAQADGCELPMHLPEKMIESTRNMGAYKPSTLIDWENGFPIELEAIWGIPQKKANDLGVPHGALSALYQQIRYQCAIKGIDFPSS